MVGPRRAAAALAACALVAQPWLGAEAQTTASQAGETLAFFATSDWGGQAAAPYTTPLQLDMAEAMGHVSASFHPHFVVSAGGNFLPGGLPGACMCSRTVAWRECWQRAWAAATCPRAGQCRGTSPADELSTSF